MKKWAKALLFLTLLFSLSFNVMAGGEEDMPEPDATEEELVEAGFPIVNNIYDTAEEYGPIQTMSTDQMGDYVSIYVKGRNINKDTVKPVFYDEDGNVISGDVMAAEVSNDKWYGGAYFRIAKKPSSAWEIENNGSCDSKYYTVKLESLCGKAILDGNNNYAAYGDQGKQVNIYRRDVFYTSFNEHDETLTLYFSSDIETENIKKLELGWYDYDSKTREYILNVVKTIEECEIIVRENKFTGHKERLARFSLKGFDYNNAFNNYAPDFRVTFVNNKTNQTEVYDTSYPSDNINQILGRVSFFQTAYKTGKVTGGRDVVLYYPYWVGGVYKFANTGSDYNYYLTKDEADYLKDERFSYAEYTKGTGRLDTGSFNNDRRYQFVYYIEVEKPAKPSGIPTVSVSVEGEDYDKYVTLTWNELSNVTGYKVYLVSENGSKYCLTKTSDTTYSFPAAIALELGYENPKVQVCAYVEKNGIVVEGDLSKALPLENSLAAPSKITLSKATYTYDGNAKKPTVTVKDTNGDTVAKANYSVKYTNNVKAGKGKVTVTFKGDYASFDPMTRTFTIEKAKASTIKLGASSYKYTGNNITPIFKNSAGNKVSSSDYTVVSRTKTKSVGTATIKVKFGGNYTTSTRTFTFKIVPKPTTISSLTALNNGFKVKWKAQKVQTTGYEIMYSKNSSFKNSTTKTVSTNYTSKSYTGLSDKKTYFVKIRTYRTVSGKKYYSSWSAVKSIKTK